MAKRVAQIESYEEVDGPDDEVEGGGLETGLIMATFLALLVALVAGFYELGGTYGVGPFK